MQRTILTMACVAIATFITQAGWGQQTVTWTGAVDFTTFEEPGNWNPTPTGGIVDPASLVDNYVIDDGSAFVQAAGTLTLDSTSAGGDVGITVTNNTFLTLLAGGIRGDEEVATIETLLIENGGNVEATFLARRMQTSLNSGGSLTLLGTGNPINNSTVDFGGDLTGTLFSFESPEDFIAEHIGKITVRGNPATLGANLTVAVQGSGSIITAMEAALFLDINRDTGAMALVNEGGAPVNFQSYAITSSAGSLDPNDWTPITGNYDTSATGDGSVDNAHPWAITSQTATELAESESPIVDGGTLGGTSSIDLGSGDGVTSFGPWVRSPFEDIAIELTPVGGATQPVVVRFVGNGGQSYQRGDYDLDNDIDGDDWSIFRSNLLTEFPGVTTVEGYFRGDWNGDFDNDENDFVAFETAYDTANGPGAFAAMVPEPVALPLLFGGAVLTGLLARRRRYLSRRIACVTVLFGLTLVMSGGPAMADFEWTGAVDTDLFNEANWVDTTTSSPPPAGAIDPAISVNVPLVISMGTPIVDDAGFAFPLQLGEGGSGGSLTLSGGVLDMVGPGGANGVRAAEATGTFVAAPFTVSGTAQADLQFILDINMSVVDNAMVTFQGGGNPVNLSTVDISSEDAVIHFTAETEAQFTAEHLSKFTSFGETAVIGTNLLVNSDGAAGVFVTAIPPLAPLGLQIDPNTGVTRMVNNTGRDIDLDFYKITGSLDVANWNSFEDQNLSGFPAGDGSGNGWEEAGGSDDAELGEAYLLSRSTFTDGNSINLGSAYDEASGSEDVAFLYRDATFNVFVEGTVEYVTSDVDGDFTGLAGVPDSVWDCLDINALSAEINAGTNDPAFDMNGDGQVTAADILDEGVGWLAVGGANNLPVTGGNPFLNGDADLNGGVDVSDFNTWNGSKFTDTDAWCSGNFNATGGVDVSDFNIWNGNKFQSSNVSAVPEPAGLLSLVVAAAAAAGWFRRHRRRAR